MNVPPSRYEMASMESRRPRLPNGMPATCPMICAIAPGVQGGPWNHVPLPITRYLINAKCQISMAFVTVELHCSMPMTWPSSYVEFVLPKTTSTTITELAIDNLEQGKVYATAVIPLDQVEKSGWGAAAPAGPAGYPPQDPAKADPELFRLTLPTAVKAGDSLKLSLTYFHPLEFESGGFLLRLPTELPPQALPPGTLPQQLIEATVTLSTGSAAPMTHISPSGHRWVVGLDQPGVRTLSLERGTAPMPPGDAVLGYKVWGTDISVSLNVTPPRAPTPNDPDPRGSFVVSLAPPAPEYSARAARSIVFVLDRSGSMDGEPMQAAKAALQFGLGLLGEGDEFNVVAFDHETLWFSPQLVPFNRQAVQSCSSWIETTIAARGMTEMMAPLQTALQMLGQAARGIPYIFLITDGCVQDERQICHMVEQATNAAEAHAQYLQSVPDPSGAVIATRPIPRLSTFGIGTYCNHYFLKQLATYGRGAFDVAFRPHAIQSQVQRMLTAAQRPVLSDITISLPGVTACELYPYPIPDLFCGAPVIFAGKYEGLFPEAINVNGKLASGAPWTSPPTRAGKDTGLPLDKIFMKTRLDLMTSRAWLQNNPQPLVDSIVDLSVATGVPCAYTRTVGFETTPAKYQQLQEQRAKQGGKNLNIAAIAIGGAAGIAIIAGVGVALAFGDIGATMANTGFGDLGGIGDVAGAGCCGCEGCEGCGDCGDCGECDIGECLDGALGACVIS